MLWQQKFSFTPGKFLQSCAFHGLLICGFASSLLVTPLSAAAEKIQTYSNPKGVESKGRVGVPPTKGFHPLTPFKSHSGLLYHPSAPESLQLLSLRRAIIGQESGANFRAVNPHSGALGYGQVMPENVPAWSEEAFGFKISPQKFLNNPRWQLMIIDYKLSQYWQKALVASHGNEELAVRRVAAQWYSGRPEFYTSTRPQYYAGHRYPSIARYTLSVLARYRSFQEQAQQVATQR